LPDSSPDRDDKLIFGEPAAGCHERTQVGGAELFKLFGRCAQSRRALLTQNREGERVVQDFRMIQKLMNGAAHRHAKGSFAWSVTRALHRYSVPMAVLTRWSSTLSFGLKRSLALGQLAQPYLVGNVEFNNRARYIISVRDSLPRRCFGSNSHALRHSLVDS
jgi:hypothetical protein